MNKYLFLLILFLTKSALAQTLIWQQYPLNVQLPINKERIVTFNEPTQLQIPDKMLDGLEFSVLEGKNYYLKATKKFSDQRVYATTQSGRQFILDMSSGDGVDDDLLLILDAKTAHERAQQAQESQNQVQQQSQAANMARNDFYILLTRYAAQQSYAPARLHEGGNISRIKIKRSDIQLFKQTPQIRATAWAQFYSAESGLYVTTVRLENLSARGVVIDVRNIRGRFLAATAQHGFLGAAGSANSVSAVYLISDTEFKGTNTWAIN